MPNLRRITLLACVLLVVLRMAIGWQVLYEGLWKVSSRETASPWSAKGFLANARGPLRPFFRALADDPDDLNWLDYDHVADRWDQWQRRFIAWYAKTGHPLSDEQKHRLDEMISGPEQFTEPLAALPEGYEFPASLTEETEFWGAKRQVIRYDEENNQLVLDGKLLLLPNERDALLRGVSGDTAAGEEFRAAVRRLHDRARDSAKQTYKIRLRALLHGDPDRAGVVLRNGEGEVVETRMGDIELYRESLARYNNALENAELDFQEQHLQKMHSDLLELKSRVIGPVKALDRELQLQAGYKLNGQGAPALLTDAQIAAGPSPRPEEDIDAINSFTIICLTTLGILLIAGLFTRTAAVAAAGMIFTFYLVHPPWPGVPPLPGPEHSLIVDKNLIEVLALLAIAALPTGLWFGVDGLLQRIFRTGRKTPQASEAVSRVEHMLAESAPATAGQLQTAGETEDIFKQTLKRLQSRSG